MVKILKTPDNSFHVQKRISGAVFFIMQGYTMTGKGMKLPFYKLMWYFRDKVISPP